MEELEKLRELTKEGDPTECEGLIREFHKKVLAVKKPETRDNLLAELKKFSSCGLSKELQEKISERGLSLEGLNLVLQYLTTTNDLAQYLFACSEEDVKKDGLEVVKRKLGPSLEVLGGLVSKNIDTNKAWVERLVNAVPSLQSLARISISDLTTLCEEGEGTASPGEMDVVRNLIKVAESRSRQLSTREEEPDKGGKEEKGNIIDEEKLEKARALMKEAKEEAAKQSAEAKEAVQKKMDDITKILQLPSDWSKQENGTDPKQLLNEMDKMIGQFDNVVEVGGPYKSDIEVVEKASGGRALCGIYFSQYVPSRTAERPLITKPAKVTLCSPNNSQQIRYLKFSESRAAANYVQTVKSSSTNIGYSVGGFASLFVGEVHGSYGSSQEEGTVFSKKAKTNSASVLQYIWVATKTFKIEQEQMRLSMSARKMAMSIKKYGDPNQRQEAARNFMTRYGSHLPAGLHTLGGVLFNTVDAESADEVETSQLTSKAAQHLQNQISVGFLGGAFGIGASVSVDHTSSTGSTVATHQETDKTSYTFAIQSMGPAATNPVTFSKLLANNSTWALIDRGDHNAYIPVWELIRDLGSGYDEVAQILQDTWNEDEKINRKKSLKVEFKIMSLIKKDLEIRRDEYTRRVGWHLFFKDEYFCGLISSPLAWSLFSYLMPSTLLKRVLPIQCTLLFYCLKYTSFMRLINFTLRPYYKSSSTVLKNS